MEDEDRYTRITLRIPKDLHSRLADSAAATSKSMNAEIIARLTDSFSPLAPGKLPVSASVREEVEEFAEANGITTTEAADTLVYAGLQPEAPAVLFVKIERGVVAGNTFKLMELLRKQVPEDATVVFQPNAPRSK